jgi:hypothetical protein
MGFSSCRQTPCEYRPKPCEHVKRAREQKSVQKSACAIEKAQHLNKNHLTSTKHNSKIATFK